MPVYAYKAVTPLGVLREDRIEATSEAHARSLLQGKREHVVALKEILDRPSGQPRSLGRGKPSADELASTVRQMSILLRAGVPLVEGLTSLAEQARSPVLHRCLSSMTKEISQGAALSDSLAQYPGVFPHLAVDMAKIAEAGGNLAEAMGRLADHMEYGAEITRKVRSALAYPIVIVVISIITIVAMVTLILPRFMQLFDRMGAQLPWTTKVLMGTSHLLTSQWYLFIGGTALAVYAIRRYAHSRGGKRKLDAMAMGLPLVGDVVSKIVISRAIASMATLLSSGVPMVQTLETSASAANNEIVREAIMNAARSVAEGNATSQALRATGIFPPLVLQMVASGEKTGELSTMLDYVCNLYRRETDAKVKSLTSIIEPIMIVILGAIVGFIAMSVIVPIYSLVGGVK